LHVLASAFDSVAGRSGGREHERDGGKSDLHWYLHMSRQPEKPNTASTPRGIAGFHKPPAIKGGM
jgi:hypothetical protein